MVKIVVLGGSFGGLTAALEIKRRLGDKAEVTVVGAEDRFVFLPSLPWLIMGWRQPADITLKISEILGPRGITFVHASALGVETEGRRLRTDTAERVKLRPIPTMKLRNVVRPSVATPPRLTPTPGAATARPSVRGT